VIKLEYGERDTSFKSHCGQLVYHDNDLDILGTAIGCALPLPKLYYSFGHPIAAPRMAQPPNLHGMVKLISYLPNGVA